MSDEFQLVTNIAKKTLNDLKDADSEVVRDTIFDVVKRAAAGAMESAANDIREVMEEPEEDETEAKAKNFLLGALAGALESGADEVRIAIKGQSDEIIVEESEEEEEEDNSIPIE